MDGVVGLACHDCRNWVSSIDQCCVPGSRVSHCACRVSGCFTNGGQIAGGKERQASGPGGGGSTLSSHVISDGTHLFAQSLRVADSSELFNNFTDCGLGCLGIQDTCADYPDLGVSR